MTNKILIIDDEPALGSLSGKASNSRATTRDCPYKQV